MTAPHKIALSFEDGVTRFIDCAENETIADAAYQAKINIPFDCRDGACGTCKAFCDAGDFDEGDYVEEALTQAEAAEGYILACQTRPLTDMVVHIASTSEMAKTAAQQFGGEIVELERLGQSIYRLGVKFDNPADLNFLAGQYVNITVPGSDEHRSYSFSSPVGSEVATFLIKHTPNGLMSTYLDKKAAVGDRLEAVGPVGSFFLREPLDPILLLAGGTGLAPIMAILEKLAQDELLDVPVRLIYGATFADELVELDRLDGFKQSLPDFDYLTVLADPDAEHPRKGYVTDHMDPVEHLHNGEADVYLCGPPPMVEAVRNFLDELDTAPRNFYFEKFNPTVPAAPQPTQEA